MESRLSPQRESVEDNEENGLLLETNFPENKDRSNLLVAIPIRTFIWQEPMNTASTAATVGVFFAECK